MPAGRPTKYKPEYCQEIIDFMSKGYSATAFAAKIGVHIDTIQEWKNTHAEFSAAYKKAHAAAQFFWENKGLENLITDGKEKFNAAVWIFWMKARFGWRDRDEISFTKDDDNEGLIINFKSHDKDD